jgi:hypothetical protein
MMFVNYLKCQQQKLNHFLRQSLHQKSSQGKQFFLSVHLHQSDQDFLVLCKAESHLKKREVALSVRRAIAHLGGIESNFIRAEITFEDLDPLPFWKNCGCAGFNTFTFASTIASELDFSLTDQMASSYPGRDPDLNIDMKIHEFVDEFYEWYSEL